MKRINATLSLLALAFATTALHAQSNEQSKKEIVIEEKADSKTEKMVIVIDGDAITINGKPAKDYKGTKRIVIDDGDISINGKRVQIPRRGSITYSNQNGEKRALLGVTTEKSDQGATISSVSPGSAAQKAGLQEGDVLTAVAGKAVTSPDELSSNIKSHKPNETVAVEYLRNGKKSTVKATLGETTNATSYNWEYNSNEYDMAIGEANKARRQLTLPRLPEWDADAFTFRSSLMRPKYGFSLQDNADGDGVKITEVETGSNAEKAGLKVGDMVTDIDGKAVKTLDELRTAITADKTATIHTLKVLRNGSLETLTLRVPKVIKKADL